MEKIEIKERCFFCDRLFHYGGTHKYYGEVVPRFKLSICEICQQANHDGLHHKYDDKFEKHLKANNLPIPEKNAKGYYPVPDAKKG